MMSQRRMNVGDEWTRDGINNDGGRVGIEMAQKVAVEKAEIRETQVAPERIELHVASTNRSRHRHVVVFSASARSLSVEPWAPVVVSQP